MAQLDSVRDESQEEWWSTPSLHTDTITYATKHGVATTNTHKRTEKSYAILGCVPIWNGLTLYAMRIEKSGGNTPLHTDQTHRHLNRKEQRVRSKNTSSEKERQKGKVETDGRLQY